MLMIRSTILCTIEVLLYLSHISPQAFHLRPTRPDFRRFIFYSSEFFYSTPIDSSLFCLGIDSLGIDSFKSSTEPGPHGSSIL